MEKVGKTSLKKGEEKRSEKGREKKCEKRPKWGMEREKGTKKLETLWRRGEEGVEMGRNRREMG